MALNFIYDDGDNNMIDENGEPVIDEFDTDDCLPLESLTDLAHYRRLDRSRSKQNSKPVISDEHGESLLSDEDLKEDKVIRRYRSYKSLDREVFFSAWIDKPGVSVSSIARSLNIEVRTAQRWVKEYKEQGEKTLTLPKAKGRHKSILGDDHKQHLQEYIDDNPSSRLQDMMDSLSDSVMDLRVSKSTLYRFLKDECVYTFKLARKDSVERNSVAKIQQSFEFVSGVLESDVDYLSNCVFIDEAGFNINMKRYGSWAPKGKTPIVQTPSTRAENRTILGAICYHG